MPSEPPWLILTQTHPLFRARIHEIEVLDALPAAARAPEVSREIVHVTDSERPHDVRGIDWEEVRARQASLFRDEVEPRLDQFIQRRIGYFGATFIPLALDFGFRLGSWRRVEVFQHHHNELHWRWTAREPSASVRTIGAPQDLLNIVGDAVIRVVTSYGIRDTHVRPQVEAPIVDVCVEVEEPGLDVLASPADLEAVVQQFRRAVELIQRNRPKTRRIHLFLSGPVGLALRIGAAIPTTCPPVVCYNFTSGVGYVRAFELSASTRGAERDVVRDEEVSPAPEQPQGMSSPRPATSDAARTLLFLAAQPRNQAGLRIHAEHDEIVRRVGRIEQAPFIVKQILAVQVGQIQEILDDGAFKMLHFSGHGDRSGALALERADGMSIAVSVQAVSELFSLMATDYGALELVLLNACHSAALAEALVAKGSARFAIGMTDAINDDAALLFAEGFYRRLAKGRGVRSAYQYGLNRLRLDPLFERQAEIPQLFDAAEFAED